MIDVKCFHVTSLSTNCYLITDADSGKMAVVDPGAESSELADAINSTPVKRLDYIFLTHGHYDHIGFAGGLCEKFGGKIVIGSGDGEFLTSNMLNLSDFHSDVSLNPINADILLEDNDTLMLGSSAVKFIATPGHTRGGGCYIIDDNIFAGDTLFCESYGRTDLLTGSDTQMRSSIARLKALHGDYKVYPGHGPYSTLEHERRYNPLMSML